MADIAFGQLKKRPTACGVCGRKSAVTPCLRCLMVIDRICYGEVRGKRVPLVRQELKQPKPLGLACKGCGRIMPWHYLKVRCAKCLRKAQRQRHG